MEKIREYYEYSKSTPSDINEFILDYTKHNLTTKHVFEKLLN